MRYSKEIILKISSFFPPKSRVERSTWEVQLALKMVIANVEGITT